MEDKRLALILFTDIVDYGRMEARAERDAARKQLAQMRGAG